MKSIQFYKEHFERIGRGYRIRDEIEKRALARPFDKKADKIAKQKIVDNIDRKFGSKKLN